MNNWMKLLEDASEKVPDGVVAAAIGRRAAALFSVLVSSAAPSSMGFCLWLGLAMSTSLKPEDMGLEAPGFSLAVTALVCIGVAGLYASLRSMATGGPPGLPTVRR